VYGAGGRRFFASAGGGAFTSPADTFGTLVQNNDNTYTYTAKDQTQTKFDTSGKITAVVDPHSLAITYTYSSGRLDTVQTPDGGVTTFSYTTALGITHYTAIAEPGGRTVTPAFGFGSALLDHLTDADSAS